MLDALLPLAVRSGIGLVHAFYALLLPAAVLISLGLAVKGRQIFRDARRALPETSTTLLIMCFNVVMVVPLLAIFSTWLDDLFRGNGIHLVSPAFWDLLPVGVVVFAAIFFGDFIGYWRHRAEHTRLLWPSHAVHHSDTEMTWLTLERFHPINRFTTVALDSSALLLLGFPVWAVIANNLVRHYYGYYVHADLPWTYGRLSKIFVSPAMHRWHHASDKAAFNTNYATVFSLFDRWFGTYRVPGPCTAPLGVTDDMSSGVVGQLAYPFRTSAYPGVRRWLRRRPRLVRVHQQARSAPLTDK